MHSETPMEFNGIRVRGSRFTAVIINNNINLIKHHHPISFNFMNVAIETHNSTQIKKLVIHNNIIHAARGIDAVLFPSDADADDYYLAMSLSKMSIKHNKFTCDTGMRIDIVKMNNDQQRTSIIKSLTDNNEYIDTRVKVECIT